HSITREESEIIGEKFEIRIYGRTLAENLKHPKTGKKDDPESLINEIKTIIRSYDPSTHKLIIEEGTDHSIIIIKRLQDHIIQCLDQGKLPTVKELEYLI
ncbi:MAG: hypothetical protein KJ874_07565, partial [Acidobacteria bacterium]|nr:hypothetical protein [Acidobacteriota bacterium]